MGFLGKRIIEVFNSIVTAPAALAAGTFAEGAAVNGPGGGGVELNVFTVLISVFIGNDPTFCM